MSIKSFNALPRPPKTPYGLPNHWHFDIRYIPLDPTPSHLLFLVQLSSSYVHTEQLPLGISTSASGTVFFPETGAEAAPEVSKALLHSFVDGMWLKNLKLIPPAYAPWKLTTDDPQLAAAVADEFKKIGVREELCKIHVVKGKALVTAQTAFDEFWQTLKVQIGLTGLAGATITTPDSIGFHNFRPAVWVGDVTDSDVQKACSYAQRLSSTRPILVEIDPRDVGGEMAKEIRTIMELINTKSATQVRAEADAGNADAAIDYALRYVRILYFISAPDSLSPLTHRAYISKSPIRLQVYSKLTTQSHLPPQSPLQSQRNTHSQIHSLRPPDRMVHRSLQTRTP